MHSIPPYSTRQHGPDPTDAGPMVKRDPAVVGRGQQRSGRDTICERDLSRIEIVVRGSFFTRHQCEGTLISETHGQMQGFVREEK